MMARKIYAYSLIFFFDSNARLGWSSAKKLNNGKDPREESQNNENNY